MYCDVHQEIHWPLTCSALNLAGQPRTTSWIPKMISEMLSKHFWQRVTEHSLQLYELRELTRVYHQLKNSRTRDQGNARGHSISYSLNTCTPGSLWHCIHECTEEIPKCSHHCFYGHPQPAQCACHEGTWQKIKGHGRDPKVSCQRFHW